MQTKNKKDSNIDEEPKAVREMKKNKAKEEKKGTKTAKKNSDKKQKKKKIKRIKAKKEKNKTYNFMYYNRFGLSIWNLFRCFCKHMA